MADTLTFMIPGKPEYVSTVRLAVSSLAGCAGFDVEAVEDIKVAVSEACAGLVCRGVAVPGAAYEVSCELCEDRIVIRVADRASVACTEPATGVSGASGRDVGLLIIQALMDEVSVLSEVGRVTQIRMIKRRVG